MRKHFSEELKEIEQSLAKTSSDNPYKDLLKANLEEMKRFENSFSFKSNISIRILSELESGTIDVPTLSAILNGLQTAFSSAVNNIKGNTNDRGIIPSTIAKESKLIIDSVAPGSFIVNFHDNENIYEQQDIFGSSKTLRNIDILDGLFKTIATIDTEGEAEQLVELYGVRTLNITKSWLKRLDNLEANFEYMNPTSSKEYQLNQDIIRKAQTKLSAIKVQRKEQPKKISGKLVGVISNSKEIELKINEQEKIKIRVLDQSLQKERLILNNIYNLDVIETKITNSADKTKVIYQTESVYGI
ncbi:hypothetical protein ACVWSE_001047 [Listeria monocytogenes]